MPIYEYKCPQCGEKFEIRRGFFSRSNDKVVCPKCGSGKPERVLSSFCTGNNAGGSCSSAPRRRFG